MKIVWLIIVGLVETISDLTIIARKACAVRSQLKVFVVFAVTEKTRKTVKCELDVPYGPTERAKYDIYGTDLPKGTYKYNVNVWTNNDDDKG